MKKLNKYILMALAAVGMVSCSLDETNYSTIDTDVAYTSTDGYDGLINSCYENLYYMYGKSDGIGPMEMGTDLWKIGSLNGSNGDVTNYNSNLTPSTGVIKTVWNALYCIVGYCNTAIYYQNHGVEFTAEDVSAKAAEARFMRAFANFHIVEQWGNVVLDTMSFAQTGMASEMAYRKPESDFYNLILSDLKIAYRDLPVSQAERGRATKKAALAMLVKAYLQRTRLYDEGSAEYKANADSAYTYATQLIENANEYDCGLYESTADKSGNAISWDGDNNKDNKEYLFIEAIDHENGYNPEGWNRGRTSQYYMMKMTQAQNFGINGSGMRYGRDNATVWSPTLYLLHDCFEPKMQKADANNSELKGLALNPDETTPDTRFADAFYYKYYAANTCIPELSTLAHYKKDTTATSPLYKRAKRMIKSATLSGSNYNQMFPGANYYAGGAKADAMFEREDVDDALGVYTPNWELDTLKTCQNKRLCVGISDYFDTSADGYGDQAKLTYFRNLFPSLRKHRCFKYVYTNQYDMMDMPVIRLTDIYLLAAEAALIIDKKQEGLKYLNAVRRHAAVKGDASLMEVTDYDMDYLLKERARELCGEQWRWYDLKRTGRLTSAYLTQKGMNPYMNFTDGKNLVRPIPQQFLDMIANPEEFGTNGY